VSMAGVHRVAALIKRWILGTHHGSVQPAHLDAYLDEFGRRQAAWPVKRHSSWPVGRG